MLNNVQFLHGNDDPRLTELFYAIKNTLYERAADKLTIASIIGVLEMVKLDLYESSVNA